MRPHNDLCERTVKLGEFKSLTIHPLSDIHIEDPSSNRKALVAKLDMLRGCDDSHRIILLGDLMDAAIMGSKGFWHGACTPDDALDELIKLFTPLANKIDLIIPGNHEERIARAAGVDISARFASLIGCADSYRPEPSVLYYNFNQRPAPHKNTFTGNIKCFVHHGHGGGRKIGGSVNKIHDLAGIVPDCDLYLMGHTHQRTVSQDVVYLGWPSRARVRTYVQTSTFEGYVPYAKKGGYLPTRCEGSPIITLSAVTGKARALVSVQS